MNGSCAFLLVRQAVLGGGLFIQLGLTGHWGLSIFLAEQLCKLVAGVVVTACFAAWRVVPFFNLVEFIRVAGGGWMLLCIEIQPFLQHIDSGAISFEHLLSLFIFLVK